MKNLKLQIFWGMLSIMFINLMVAGFDRGVLWAGFWSMVLSIVSLFLMVKYLKLKD